MRGETSHVTSGRRCFSCDSPEHFIRDCPEDTDMFQMWQFKSLDQILSKVQTAKGPF